MSLPLDACCSCDIWRVDKKRGAEAHKVATAVQGCCLVCLAVVQYCIAYACVKISEHMTLTVLHACVAAMLYSMYGVSLAPGYSDKAAVEACKALVSNLKAMSCVPLLHCVF